MSKLAEMANKLQNKQAQEVNMVKVPLTMGDLLRRLNQISGGSFKSVHPTGHAWAVVNKLVSGQPVSDIERKEAVADIMNFGDKNAELGLTQSDLETAVRLIETGVNYPTASTAVSDLVKMAKKLEDKKFEKCKACKGTGKVEKK